MSENTERTSMSERIREIREVGKYLDTVGHKWSGGIDRIVSTETGEVEYEDVLYGDKRWLVSFTKAVNRLTVSRTETVLSIRRSLILQPKRDKDVSSTTVAIELGPQGLDRESLNLAAQVTEYSVPEVIELVGLAFNQRFQSLEPSPPNES